MVELSPIERLERGNAPRRLRIAIAEGMIPLDDAEMVKAFGTLAVDPDQEVVDVLQENLVNLPRNFLIQTSRDHSTSEHLLDLMSGIFLEDNELLANIILNRNVLDNTLVKLAGIAPVPILEMLAGNRNRMLACPEILDILMANEQLPKVLFYSLTEFKIRFKDSFAGLDEALDLSEEADDTQSADEIADEHKPGETADYIDDDDLDIDDMQLDEFDDFDDEEPDDDGWNIDNIVAEFNEEENRTETSGDGVDFEDDPDFLEFEDEDDQGADSEVVYEGWDELGFDDEMELDEDDDEELDEEAEEERIVDTRMRMLKMGASEKMLLAKMGSKQERMILVRDSNKKVAVAVVEGPKMSEFEVKLIAGNRSICEDVLRAINNHRVWGQKPVIRKELVLNPKTPLSVSLRLLNSLNDFDLKEVVKSKEIPYGVTANAKRLFDQREKRRQRRIGQ